MKTILAAIDFSATTRPVVNEAVALARKMNGRVILLHVVQLPVFVNEYGLMGENLGKMTDAMEEYAQKQLRRWQTQAGGKARVKTVQLTGMPVGLILEQAKKETADYLVIGSHGHTAIYDFLVGSTASGVLKRARCPVVIVSSPRRRGR
jgi:nucleotide-binding universal stress UspA family protein